MPDEDVIRASEYSSLRNELDGNRKYVFERPLLILGGTIVLSANLPQPLGVFVRDTFSRCR
jgi:hypothetical protein